MTRDLNPEIPACITKDSVPKVIPSYQAGHEPIHLHSTACSPPSSIVIEPPIAGKWVSHLVGEALDPFSTFPTICKVILNKVLEHQPNFKLIREVWPYETKYIVITRSVKFSRYKDMDPSNILKSKER